MAEWQSIETASDDMDEVIVYEPPIDRGRWSRCKAGVRTAMNISGSWYASSGDEMVDLGGEYTELIEVYPTHWMPLPDPPLSPIPAPPDGVE